uniref:Retrovirus-related Pol polyprotein from transposon TNT 1-94 n=1 Tax=Tanacetum cinerariifolium TaxID=118510 RepID=A0A6L2KN21_TANCI|nr:retrovirus-related Pol polyprotein from transposon TNT 1-94 [Tanacetum cinerariifolium]
MGLWYSKDTGMSLTAYSDADHAGVRTRRSTSGSTQFLGDKLVSWSFKKKKSAAISSTEAEYISLSGSTSFLGIKGHLPLFVPVEANVACDVILLEPALVFDLGVACDGIVLEQDGVGGSCIVLEPNDVKGGGIVEHERMILELVENGPLIWPTIEENGVTRTKKYAELSAAKKIQADCDMKATNIILQDLPADIYSLMNHHRVAKDLWERV